MTISVVPAVVLPEFAEEKLAVPDGGRQPLVVVDGGGRLGQCRQEEGVPLGEDLVVQARAHALLPRLEQALASAFDGRRP